MKITAGQYYLDQGIMPTMELTIDGYQCRFGDGIKRTILDEFGAVPVLGYPKDKLAPIPAPKYDLEFKGFTTDPNVIRLVRRYLKSCDDGTFTVGEIDVT